MYQEEIIDVQYMREVPQGKSDGSYIWFTGPTFGTIK